MILGSGGDHVWVADLTYKGETRTLCPDAIRNIVRSVPDGDYIVSKGGRWMSECQFYQLPKIPDSWKRSIESHPLDGWAECPKGCE